MRPTKAHVDLDALRHNLAVAAGLAPASKNVAVIKANGYGHGMVEAARALQDKADALGVATMDEAVTLRENDITAPLLVLQGITTRGDAEEAAARDLWLLLHERGQLDKVLALHGDRPVTPWLKIDTGMHRLGFSPEEAADACAALLAAPNMAQPPVLATHMACADERDNPATREQLECFLAFAAGRGLPLSMANSAGIMHWPATHADWNRPGIMLYGCDPTGGYADDGPLRPVMTLVSEIMAVRDVAPGEGVGYGHRWRATEHARIGTISMGYADGYPRHAGNGTPVWVKGKRAPLAGTVSMDMITVDLSGRDDVKVGDAVELWGPNIPVNEVAAHAGTIGYDILAGMTGRVPRVYRQAAKYPG
jgi:alanine racemase